MLVTIFVGPAGCGKSTIAKAFIEEGFSDHILETDQIRKKLHEELNPGSVFSFNDYDFRNEKEVWKRFNSSLIELLQSKKDFIISNTNLVSDYRKEIYQKAKEHGYRIRVVFFNISQKTCEKRIKARDPENKNLLVWNSRLFEDGEAIHKGSITREDVNGSYYHTEATYIELMAESLNYNFRLVEITEEDQDSIWE